MPKSDTKEIAAVLADIASSYNGKTETQIRRQGNAKAREEGAVGSFWDDENPIPRDAADIAKVVKRFGGKGPVEIEEELNDMTGAELSEYRVLAKNPPFLPGVTQERRPPSMAGDDCAAGSPRKGAG